MEEHPSFFFMLLNAIFLLFLVSFSFIWFFYSLYNLTLEIEKVADVVTFNKGSMYMLGVGIGLIFLLFGIVQKGLFKKELSQKRESFLIRGSVVGVVIMFALPNIVDWVVDQRMRQENYIDCEGMSYQWLLYKKYVYTKNQQTCVELVNSE